MLVTSMTYAVSTSDDLTFHFAVGALPCRSENKLGEVRFLPVYLVLQIFFGSLFEIAY